jgi:hypothetical protein
MHLILVLFMFAVTALVLYRMVTSPVAGWTEIGHNQRVGLRTPPGGPNGNGSASYREE